MNKEKILYGFNKLGREGISKYDFYTFIGSLVLGAFGLDFNLHYVTAVAGFFFIAELFWIFFSLLSLYITELIIRKSNKKKVGEENENK